MMSFLAAIYFVGGDALFEECLECDDADLATGDRPNDDRELDTTESEHSWMLDLSWFFLFFSYWAATQFRPWAWTDWPLTRASALAATSPADVGLALAFSIIRWRSWRAFFS